MTRLLFYCEKMLFMFKADILFNHVFLVANTKNI